MDKKSDEWIVVGKELINYEVFNVVIKEVKKNSIKTTFNILECPDWVNIIALTDDNELVLVKQFRLGIDSMTYEIPAGIVNGNILETAKEELIEETGYISDSWYYLGSVYPNPALQNNKCHSYFCLNANLKEFKYNDKEPIKPVSVSIADFKKLVKSNHFDQSLIISALFLLRRFLEESKVSHTPILYDVANAI
jgi:ADP-ribose pyrophosphatase